MKRRNFLQSSLLSCFGAGAFAVQSSGAKSADSSAKKRELYELRVYTLKDSKKPVLDEYLSKAFIPALGRLGIATVGVFSEKAGADKTAVYVLIVFQSAEQVFSLASGLAADAEHQRAGEAYLSAVAADPVYERIESSVLSAIEGLPGLEKTDTSKPRILNLRVYESHNERAGKKKVEMFNSGELDIFREVGLTPVFFAETVIGSRIPNLTYMLVFPDDAARGAAWGRFGANEKWRKLKSVPEYADKEIVSKITNKILQPEPYSKI
jgi:hypothetical protein